MVFEICPARCLLWKRNAICVKGLGLAKVWPPTQHYNFYKGAMGFVVTWQELWMLVGSGFGMVNFELG